MDELRLTFLQTPWLILPCLALGAGVAYFLYQKKGPWSEGMNRLLTALRFILVSTIAFLILGPLLQYLRRTVEDPSFIVAIDNSQSLAEVMDSTALQDIVQEIAGVQSSLESGNYRVDLINFSSESPEDLENLVFDAGSSDLSGILDNIQQVYQGSNLNGVILLSDGIYNSGVSPLYKEFSFPVYTVGVGDTLPKSDIAVQNVFYNKIAYQGNSFPVIAEILQTGFNDERVQVSISRAGEVIEEQELVLSQALNRVEFQVVAEEVGAMHYVVQVRGKSGEYTVSNNLKHVYLDVIDGKQKILLVARAPHPDIKAFRQVAESKENYELVTYIEGLGEQDPDVLKDKYDLVILYQIPGRGTTVDLQDLINRNNAVLFVTGNQSSLPAFNQINGVVEISARMSDKDVVTPLYNSNFSRFRFEGDNRQALTNYPPLETPFGDYVMQNNAEVILYQQFGSVNTRKPLMAVAEVGEKKHGVIIGENFWRWRLQEYAESQTHEAFDELFGKLIQYLSAREDKRKFKVYPVNNEFSSSEPAVFETEVYNDIYEQVYGIEVDLTLTHEDGEANRYQYVTSEANSRFQVSNLTPGSYSYAASALVNGKTETAAGSFLITELQVETLNLTANFGLLRALARQSGGEFYTSNEIAQLNSDLGTQEARGMIHTSASFLPLISLQWILLLLIVLVSVEWFVRKFEGSY